MDAEIIVRNQIYVDLDENRAPRGFFKGGLNRPDQIPDGAVPISADLHAQWRGNTRGRVLSQDGAKLERAPDPVVTLAARKRHARVRVHREAEDQARKDIPRRSDRQARVWVETVKHAVMANTAGSIAPGQFAFVDAYLAGSLVPTLLDAVTEILALDEAEQAAEAATELIVQTALGVIEDAILPAEITDLFPLFGE